MGVFILMGKSFFCFIKKKWIITYKFINFGNVFIFNVYYFFSYDYLYILVG